MPISINRSLNIVIPISGSGGQIYAYSIPVSKHVFDQYTLVLAKVRSMFDTEKIWPVAPKVALSLLRDIARTTLRLGARSPSENYWDGPLGVEQGLLNEIRRLTTVVLPNGAGWETVPLANARLDPDDLETVESILVFFTCVSATTPLLTHEMREFLGSIADGLSLQLTSSTPTDFANSLPTSTATANSGATVPT